MEAVRDNAVRVKRFRALKATRRTNRERLLVGIDVAQAEHVIHLRHAHTRVVVPTLTIPNTARGFTQLWAAIQRAQRTTGCREVVCGLEPTGTYHQSVASVLEAQGADEVFLSSSVASGNRRTQDGTWDKHDRKDAVNCVDLLEQGKVLFYSQPTSPLLDQRRLPRGVGSARHLRGGSAQADTAGGHRRACLCGHADRPRPLSAARTRPGGSLEAAGRPDGTTTVGRERSPGSGLGAAGRRNAHDANRSRH
jgi:hypothetical protein